MRRFFPSAGFRIAVGALLTLALAAGVAFAAIPDSNGSKYHTCMLKAPGTIRLIDLSLPASNLLSHCTSLETELTWNQQGPQGLPGAAGAKGEKGDKGDRTTRSTARPSSRCRLRRQAPSCSQPAS